MEQYKFGLLKFLDDTLTYTKIIPNKTLRKLRIRKMFSKQMQKSPSSNEKSETKKISEWVEIGGGEFTISIVKLPFSSRF